MQVASVVVVLTSSLVACAAGRSGGGGGGGGGEPGEAATFRVFYPDQPADGFHAKVGKRFYVKPVATCTYANGRDARWSMTGASLDGGTLPGGFTLEDGAIAGIATAAGTWSLKVKFSGVTCAGKPHDAVVIDVLLTAR